jgi:hypothetical protein
MRITKQTQYELKENRGRTKFNDLCNELTFCKVLKFAKNKYTRWDVAFTFKEHNIIGEIKYRNNTINKYPDYILEVEKLVVMRELTKEKDVLIFYINHFNDGNTLIWNITDIDLDEIEIFQQWCQINDWDTDEKKLKDIILLKKEDAIYNSDEK